MNTREKQYEPKDELMNGAMNDWKVIVKCKIFSFVFP